MNECPTCALALEMGGFCGEHHIEAIVRSVEEKVVDESV